MRTGLAGAAGFAGARFAAGRDAGLAAFADVPAAACAFFGTGFFATVFFAAAFFGIGLALAALTGFFAAGLAGFFAALAGRAACFAFFAGLDATRALAALALLDAVLRVDFAISLHHCGSAAGCYSLEPWHQQPPCKPASHQGWRGLTARP
ncbi:3-deoxy-D-manno-octulosonic acid kinase [Mizugakiibacter sediminis]|uniref:3-deoxy-D-manno-octulosonic acid kinase n=1 Tax=Mizugakiibacter sediminis TaxID=1475481 RepID=A0A0K8QLW7_9GAMM|nr:3-deoxy-D-manno-octulosonic acid kinase [Mizugakiibacter sediminis]